MFPFKQAYDSIKRNKIFKIVNYFGMPTNIVKLVSATMEGANHVLTIHNDLSEHFEVNKGLKEGAGLVPILFNRALEYAIRQLPIDVTSSLIYRSGQIVD
jgi:hypothetical protein